MNWLMNNDTEVVKSKALNLASWVIPMLVVFVLLCVMKPVASMLQGLAHM